jgi:hypothetical protein
MPVHAPQGAIAERQAATVSQAVHKSAELLHLNQTLVAEVLGLSPSSVSRLYAGTYLLRPEHKKKWELALLFLRLFRSIDALLGHGEQARAWLEGDNLALGARPLDLIRTQEGLVRVIQYLDAYRGRI